ncbi:MAG: hypothetical protein AB7O78_19755 [Thermoleophilia bacterium]
MGDPEDEGGLMVKRLSAMCVAVVAMALVAGCGGGSGSAHVASSPPATTAAAAATTATVATPAASFDPENVLPALSEMPTGWVKDEDDDDDKVLCDTHLFDPATAQAEVTYSDQGQLPQLEVKAGSFPPGGAAEAMRQGRATYDACKQYERDGITWTVSPASFPALGEDSFAYLATADVQGVDVAALFIVMRSGDGVVGVAYGDFASVDTSAVEGYARRALARLKEAQQ